MVPKMWDQPLWEGVWPYVDPWDSVCLRTASTHWNVQGKYCPHGELFFLLLKKEPTVVLSELIEFGQGISAETVKACALIGLHMLAEEIALRSDSDPSPDLGACGGMAAQKKKFWRSNGVEWAGSEATSSLEYHEHNVGNLALEVVGQNWSSEVISFLRRLGGWAGGIKLPLVNGPFMPRNEGCVLGELRVAGSPSFAVFRLAGWVHGGRGRDGRDGRIHHAQLPARA